MAQATSPSGSLTQASGVMAVATALSRALGFVRTAVWAWAVGLNIVGTAFMVANTVPNIVYILLAGGVLNAVFVPQLVRATRRGEDASRAYTDRLLTLSGVVLLVITVIATAAAPILVRLYAGTNWSPADVALATAFAFWCIPQIFFYGLYTMLGQVLSARDNFGPVMWAPILNNVVAIATGAAFILVGTVDTGSGPGASGSLSSHEIAFLGAGTTLGVVLQALVLIPVLRHVGFRYRPRFDFRGAGLGKAGHLAIWTLLFVAVNQVAYWVVTKVANTAGKAAQGVVDHAVGLPAYSYAYLVLLLPHAVVTVSLVTSMLPRMSAAAAERRLADVRADVSTGLRLTGAAMIPSAAIFLALGPLLTRVMLFGNSTADARYVGYVLMGFAPGLVVFSAQYVVVRGFYALEDTRTPFLIQSLIAVVNVVLVLLAYHELPTQWVVVGMAVGYSMTYVVGLAVSVSVLRRRIGGVDGQRVALGYLRLVGAALAPALIAAGLASLATRTLGFGLVGSTVGLLGGVVIFGGGFPACARLLRVGELDTLWSLLRRRR